jgi:hypothetical protein
MLVQLVGASKLTNNVTIYTENMPKEIKPDTDIR